MSKEKPTRNVMTKLVRNAVKQEQKMKIDYGKLLAIGLPLVIATIKEKIGSRSIKPMMVRDFRNEMGKPVRITIDTDNYGIRSGMKITISGSDREASWSLSNVEAAEVATMIFRKLSEG